MCFVCKILNSRSFAENVKIFSAYKLGYEIYTPGIEVATLLHPWTIVNVFCQYFTCFWPVHYKILPVFVMIFAITLLVLCPYFTCLLPALHMFHLQSQLRVKLHEYASTSNDFASMSTSKRSASILERILTSAYSHFTQTVLVHSYSHYS